MTRWTCLILILVGGVRLHGEPLNCAGVAKIAHACCKDPSSCLTGAQREIEAKIQQLSDESGAYMKGQNQRALGDSIQNTQGFEAVQTSLRQAQSELSRSFAQSCEDHATACVQACAKRTGEAKKCKEDRRMADGLRLNATRAQGAGPASAER